MRERFATKATIGWIIVSLLGVLAVEVAEVGLKFTSISVVDTNLVLRATNPAGLTGVTVETRADLQAEWQTANTSPSITSGGELEFVIPKPDGIQFMRLRASPADASRPAISTPLNYVTIPPLKLETNPATGQVEAVLHFKGRVDGSDKILIKREGLFWEHVNWNWPEGDIAINQASWRPAEQNYVTVAGAAPLLPHALGLDSVTLEIIKARDLVAVERTRDGLMVYVNDTVNGADDYEFAVHFHPPKRHATRKSTPATLKIKAVIDGSDCLHITANEARWEHFQWRMPETVSVNSIEWNPAGSAVLKNKQESSFLPAGVDLATARVVERKGRDLAAIWADENELRVYFADNPVGADTYELTIAFGQ